MGRTESLDPDLAALLAESAATSTDERSWSELTVAEARERCRAELLLTSGPGDQSVTARDMAIAASRRQVPLRIYHPAASQASAAAPVVVYIHGGGFVLGGLDTHDAICRDMVATGGFVCVAVGYRLSPEHHFPAALDDCVETLKWVHEHVGELSAGTARVALAGDSAGGNLAAAACLVLRDQGLALPELQLLIYPVVDLTMSADSTKAYGPEFGLSTEDLAWFYANYLGEDGNPADPYVSPWLATDLSGLPLSHVVTVGFDPLRDEGLGYVESLRAAGVPTSTKDYPGLIHGAFELAAVIPASRSLLEDVAHRLALPGE
ncbi:MAG: alpha/beta hydrolase [Acidimicrobiales bacterium]|jgi:acetyl esterase